MAQKQQKVRSNTQITATEVRLITDTGEMKGVVPLAEALDAAKQAKLDLVEVSPNAEPPVCKLLDYGKYLYQQKKRANEAKKHQKKTVVKEIKLRPNIDTNDYQVKMRKLTEFLEAGDKVKISLRFRGRELSHKEIGMALLRRIESEYEEILRVEQSPRMEGRQMTMMVAAK